MKQNTSSKICGYAFIIVFVFFSLLPFVWIILTSLKSANQIYDIGQIIPTHVTTENYYKAIQEAKLLTYFKNSVIVGVCTTFVCIILSVTSAYGLVRYNILFGNKLKMGILYTRMFPAVLLSLPYYIMMRNFQLGDTLIGLIIVNCSFTLPFCIWNIQTFFNAMPWELEEAACVDGASRLRAVVQIMLPIARPGILVTSLYAFIMSWEEFMFANLFINTTSKKTIQLGVQSFIGEYSTDWGGLMAAAVISFLPIVLFFAIVQKKLIQGATAGAVKG